jgi:hypothetical protein
MPATLNLQRLDCTAPGPGPWKVFPDIGNRSVNIRHTRNGHVHRVFYGTRTKRTQEDATAQATALCAVLNAFKAKRP